MKRRLGLSVLQLGGALAVLAVLAPLAVAARPEIGRCVAVTPHTGEYTNKSCVRPSAGGEGTYDFLPGAGEKKKFQGTAIEGITLETVGSPARVITCNASTEGSKIAGEYTSPKEATVNLTFNGCVYPATGRPCQSNPLKEGQITGTGLQAQLGFIREVRPQVGWDLKGSSGPLGSPNLLTFECGKPPETATTAKVFGSVIGQVTPIDKMAIASTLRYRETAGKQHFENLEGEPKDTLETTFESGTILEKMFEAEEQTGLKTTFAIESEEPLEIKAK